jgi:hypothetical protein
METSKEMEKIKQHMPIKGAWERFEESRNGGKDEIEALIKKLKGIIGLLGKSIFPPINHGVD